MKLTIISAQDILFKGEVDLVTLPGAMGSFTVLKNHATLISTLTAGRVSYTTTAGEQLSTPITGGIVDIDNNEINVCVY